MRNRVERLRMYLLSSAIFLLLVIAAFLGAARYLRRQSAVAFPLQMARDILRETKGWTYCPSEGSTKKFCVHAANAVEYRNGKVMLHDASITLYGAKGDRSDRLYGDEFEYDRSAEIVRAPGIVHIDLQAAGRGGDPAKVMHVTTSGLVYLQKLGVASTSEAVDFAQAGLSGHAVGADYSSDSALITLHSAVRMSGVQGGHAVAMTAATASYDDNSRQAMLTHATYESEGRKAAAEQATLYRRPDGTLSRVDASGNVTLEATGSTVVAGHADVALTAESHPQTVVLTGGIKFSRDEPLRQMSGTADAATVQFDDGAKIQPTHATIAGMVHATERIRAKPAANEPWSTRELKAGRVEVVLARNEAGKAEVRDVTAAESPRVIVTNNGSLASSRGKGTTEIAADTLNAHMLPGAGDRQPPQVDTIAGRGNTRLRQVTAEGKEETVAADTLDAKLRPRTAGGGAGGLAGTASDDLAQGLLSAVQQGHVQMMQHTPASPRANPAGRDRADVVQHALADRAVYDGDSDRMTLSGGVQWSDPKTVLWANQVTVDEKTGDANAAGAVKVSYAADASGSGARGQSEPAHVVADRAELNHATGTSTFYGKPVRLWQEGNQILAPVIVLSNTQNSLVAHGDAGTGGMAVRTVLAETKDTAADAKAGAFGGLDACPTAATTKGGSSVPSARGAAIVSGMLTLTFSGETGQADFTGGFRADTADGTIRASEGIVFLRQNAAPKNVPGQNGVAAPLKKATPASFALELDRIEANGRIELDKPGLKATGERLVYTANDRTVVLTGDAKNPPKAAGSQGTATGNALRLRSSCEGLGGVSVEVVGAPGQRAHTDARVSEAGKKEKQKR